MRVEGWDRILTEELAAAHEIEFQWGSQDCALWAASIIQKITGKDYGVDFRGRYSDSQAAYDVIHQRADGLNDLVSSYFELIDIRTAMRGDLVMKTGALGICFGINSCFLMEHKGITAVPTLDCYYAWRVD